MHEIVEAPAIPPMSEAALATVRHLEDVSLTLPQVEIGTEHVIHGGLYARTICIPAGVVLTGALIKIATLLIVQGDAVAYVGTEQPLRLVGYNVLPASAGRKQAFLALADTNVTMVFPTEARTVEEAERQFTDEAERLFSRSSGNRTVITGE